MFKKLLVMVVFLGATFSTQFAHAQFQDNAFRYWYSSAFREPDTNNGQNISKNIISFTHVDGGNKYGNNFLNVDLLKSNAGDPTAGDPTIGAVEVYVVYRHDVSLNRVTKSKKFSFGPIKDVLITAGADLNTKNTAFAPEKRMPVFGPTFAIKVRKGFWDVSLLWDKEWNHDGFGSFDTNPARYNPGGGVEFHSAAMLATAWSIPLFKIAKAPLSFDGFGDINSAKGPDGAGIGTRPETLLHPKLMYNFGQLISEKHNWQLGFGYEYWNNKFGEDNRHYPGACANAPFAELAIHL
jgi:hypothetical protein